MHACHPLFTWGYCNTPAGQYGPPPHIGTWRLPPVLPPAGDTPTDTGNTQADLIVYAHAPKTHTTTKQQGGMSIHVFYCEDVYRLLYVCEWFMDSCLFGRVSSLDTRPPLRERHSVTPSGRVCTSGPCSSMCGHDCVLCLSVCIALLCIYMICNRSMAPRWCVRKLSHIIIIWLSGVSI